MRRAGTTIALLAGLTLGVLLTPAPAAAETPTQLELRHRMEALQARGRLTVGGVRVSAIWLLGKLYSQNRFERVWTDPKKVDDLLRAISDSYGDGLDPQDYYLDRLKKLRQEVATKPEVSKQVDLDILLTDALTRLAYNMFYGKVDPERIDPHVNLEQPWRGPRGAEGVRQFIASDSLYAQINTLRPTMPRYDRFRRALAQYRVYGEAGGWGRVSKGKVLSVGRTDSRVPAIRHRLAVTGDLPRNLDDGSTLYDAALEKAVHRFQSRHRLPTGDLGSKTIAELNVPVGKRIDQIRVNLERARWFTRDVVSNRVVVNIAAFEIYFFKDGKLVWQNEAQVGKTYTQTPLFVDDIEYLVLNPTWTAPPGVIEDSVLPAARKDPKSVTRRGLRVFDASGREVPATSVDWKRYTAKTLPYTLRQDPGPKNPLGSVKFIFPNPHHVYLHDTPNQLGYDRRLRAMSWGCIHVQDPLELAAWAIDDPKNWPLEKVQAQVKSGKTKTIHFESPLRVALFYWTFEVGEDGVPQFLEDPYRRDTRVLRGLNGPFKLRKTHRRGDPND